MSRQFSQFPGGFPPKDTDRFLIGRVDVTSPSGFSNFILTWAQIKGLVGGTSGPLDFSARDGDDGEDGMPIPGAKGATGSAGIAGIDGKTIFMLPEFPDDPEEPLLIPGPRGTAGTNGVIGVDGKTIFLAGDDPVEPDEPLLVQGPRGVTGAAGIAGPAGATFFPEVDDADEPFVVFPQPIRDPDICRYAPGGFTIPNGFYAMMSKMLQLTGVQTLTVLGTGQLRIS